MPTYYLRDGESDEDREFAVETLDDGRFRITGPDGEEAVLDAFALPEGGEHFLSDADSHDIDVREVDGAWEVARGGRRHRFEVLSEAEKRMEVAGVGGRGAAEPELSTPMAGTVVEVDAEVGDEVEEGEPIVIVEAMKMENGLDAHRSGTVGEILVSPGDSVENGDALLTIEEG